MDGYFPAPDDAEIAQRWIKEYPETIWFMGQFNRFKIDRWIMVNPDVIRKEILDVMRRARGYQITLKNLNSVLELARIEVSATTKEKMDAVRC